MFKSIIKTSVIAIAAVTFMSTANAEDEVIIFENITNGQINLTDVLSDVNINVGEIGELADINSTAHGNNFVLSASVDAAPIIFDNTQQSNTDNIISRVNLTVEKTPTINIDSEAIANKAIVISKGFGHNTINNVQNSGAALPPPPPPAAPPAPRRVGDPLSDVTVTAGSIDDLDLNSTAGGNMAQFVLAGHANTVNSFQENDVMNNSLVNLDIGSVTNSLKVDSKAWGNSLVLVLGEIPTETPSTTQGTDSTPN